MIGFIILLIGVAIILFAYKSAGNKKSKSDKDVIDDKKDTPSPEPIPGPAPWPNPSPQEPVDPDKIPVVLLHYEPNEGLGFHRTWVCPNCETENDGASLRCRICDEAR